MKNILSKLNKAFENRIRLGIMSVLVVNDWVDFNTLKELLETTDGNLASHLKALETKELVEMRKQFIGRKPRTSYRVTHTGRELFKEHIKALENLINTK
jgi:DNA-binding HxlR family transcriptional regulator